jgi:hypothetical protein
LKILKRHNQLNFMSSIMLGILTCELVRISMIIVMSKQSILQLYCSWRFVTILAVWMQTEKYYGTWSCIDGEENSEGAAVPITEEEEPCYPYKPTCK